MGPNNTKNSSLKCDFHIINYEQYCQNLVLIVKNTKFDQKTVSLLCVKTKSGAHKQLTFYFQMWKYVCRLLHSSLISMVISQSICPLQAFPAQSSVQGQTLQLITETVNYSCNKFYDTGPWTADQLGQNDVTKYRN